MCACKAYSICCREGCESAHTEVWLWPTSAAAWLWVSTISSAHRPWQLHSHPINTDNASVAPRDLNSSSGQNVTGDQEKVIGTERTEQTLAQVKTVWLWLNVVKTDNHNWFIYRRIKFNISCLQTLQDLNKYYFVTLEIQKLCLKIPTN